MITFCRETKTFYLETAHSSYVMRVLPNGMLHHVYYGARIAQDDLCGQHLFIARELSPDVELDGVISSPDCIPQEYACFGRGDFREASVAVRTPDGRQVNELSYVTHQLTNGKPTLDGLPQLQADEAPVQTLQVTLRDTVSGFDVNLYYTVFEEEDLIARHCRIVNQTEESLYLLRAASVCVDLQAVADYDVLTLDGTWARERAVHRRPLCAGTVSTGARRGASGHQHNPFVALLNKDANEDTGEVYGCALVYSGDCRISVEQDAFETTRLQLGIDPDTFTWKLKPHDTFITPEGLLVYSDKGLNGMSRSFHAACRRYLGRCADRRLPHPIVVNNWEAMYFTLNEEKITRFIRSCAGLGIDTVVMDDGWFGHRNSDSSSLGDWYINKEKFPNSRQGVIDVCQ